MPLEINRVVKIKYRCDYKSEWHAHRFYHFIYVMDGTGRINISGNDYIAKADQCLLIKPQEYHGIYSYKQLEFKTIEVKFVVNNALLKEHTDRLPQICSIDTPHIRYMLECLLIEASKKDCLYECAVNSQFTDLLIKIIRINTGSAKIQAYSPHLKDTLQDNEILGLKEALDFIHQNIGENIHMKEVANAAGLSESRFYSLFKERFKISPIRYIQEVKINKAKEMMLRTGMNVTQTAYSLGFSSLHYFSKFFKKMEGVPPRAYLNQIENDIRVDISNGSSI